MPGDQRDPAAGGAAGEALPPSVAAKVSAVIAAAESLASDLRHEAEERAQARLREAEAEAERYLEEARRSAGGLAGESPARLLELSDAVIDRSAAVLEQLDREAASRRELRVLLELLVDAAERLAGEARPGDAPSERAERSAEPLSDVVPFRRPRAAGRSDDAEDELEPPGDARLVALQMAVAGSSRGEVAAHLRRAFDIQEPHAILDDVFGKVLRR